MSCDSLSILDEGFNSESCCFFPGDRAQIAVRLGELILPTHVTIDYVLPSHAMIHRAPRHLVLWGLVDGVSNKAVYQSLSQFRAVHQSLGEGPLQSGPFIFLPFANFTFDGHAPFPFQTFPIHSEIVSSGMTSGVYILEVRSNWGGNSTGICRMRLHGEQAA